jgi:hypothetical protein
MAIDFSIDDTDIYTENEKEFSEQEAINKALEWKRCNTTTAIDDTQKGLIPRFLDVTWNKTDTYFKNGSYAVSRDYFETCVKVNGILTNICEDKERFFFEKMVNGYNNNILKPFLLFINKVHIAWSRITVARSDFNISLLISDMDKDIVINDLQIISLPFKVIYTEDEDEQPLNILYRFNKDGAFSYDSSIFVYADNDKIQTKIYKEDRYKNYDMQISYTRKITPNNLVVFDQFGRLEKNISIDVKNTNLLTMDDSFAITRYVSCCYHIESNYNEANTTRVRNEQYEKQFIDGFAGFPQMDENMFLSDFDFTHNRSLPYSQNISNSLDYVFGYDENKLDKVFEDIKPVNIMQYDASYIIRRYNESSDGSITMLKDIYEGDNLESFPIIFYNGMVPAYYKNIKYTQTSFSFKPGTMNYKDTFEIAYFKKVNNNLIKLNIANKGDSSYLNVKDYYIPKEDIVVYSACRGETNLFPINYTIDGNDNIILKNPRYLEAQLYIGSKNQFIYESINLTANGTVINLSDKFRTAYNEKKFMVFINGRYLNSINYRVLIPSLNNSKITNRAIYTMKTIKPTDRIDIFYCNSPKISRVNINGDLLIHCIKSKATTDKQKRFKVPYPFTNYPREYDSFFCIRNSIYLDKNKYTIDGDYIEIINQDDYLDFARDLIFVFPYYRPPWINENEVDPDSNIDFISRYKRLTVATNTITFTPDYHGNVVDKSAVNLFIGSTFVDPARYNLTSNNTVVFPSEVIPKDTMMTMVIETDEELFANDNILLEAVPVVATENNQSLFDIPKIEYYDSFFIMVGSVLMSPDRYFITDDYKLLLINDFDSMPKNKKLTFVFVKDKRDGVNPNNIMHTKTEFIHFRPKTDTTSLTIPTNYYHRFKFNKESVLVFINSTYVPNSSFDIVDSKLTLTTSGDIFKANKSVVLMLAYRDINYKKIDAEIQNREIIKFEDKYSTVLYDGHVTHTIPYPNLPFTDTEFIISVGTNILNPDSYTITGNSIKILDPSIMKKDRKITFTFVHNGGFTYISKKQVSVKVSIGQEEVSIPSPYDRLVNLRNRMILTSGNAYIDQTRYIVDNKEKKILLTDFPITDSNRSITFTFFFTGSEYNGAMAYLPESGYVCFLRKEIVSNFNKEMYMMFINGRKVSKSELLDISNNMVKVSTDIQRRYDLVVLNCSPTVTELKSRYGTMSTWTKMLDPLPI